MPYIPDFKRPFTNGLQIEYDGYEYTFEVRTIGELVVPTGQIAVDDPLTFRYSDEQDKVFFKQTITTGKYPVVLSIAHVEGKDGSKDRRVACAKLQISSALPHRWEVATKGDQDISKLSENAIFGYGVDSGLGCFIDRNAANILMSKYDQDDFYYQELLDILWENEDASDCLWADIVLDQRGGANLIMFHSGWGDGFYATYWGYDNEGRLASLVTNFDVLPEVMQ